MNKIFVDGAYNHQHQIGFYCVVVISQDSKPIYQVSKKLSCDSAYHIEALGLEKAIDHASTLPKPTTVFCDNVRAIKSLSSYAEGRDVELEYVRAHQFGKPFIVPTDNVKAHHFTDRLARGALRNTTRQIENRSVELEGSK